MEQIKYIIISVSFMAVCLIACKTDDEKFVDQQYQEFKENGKTIATMITPNLKRSLMCFIFKIGFEL